MNNQNQPASPDVSQGGQPTTPQEPITPQQPQPKPKFPTWLSVSGIVIAAEIVLGLVVWGGYELFKPAPPEETGGEEGTEQEEEKLPEDEFADWKTYQNEKYGFEIQYPGDWKATLVENPFNMTICKGDCFEKDNIQMVEGIPNFVSRGSIDANTNYLKEVIKEGFNKLKERSITEGKGFYGISETKGGPSPSAYLIGKDRVFLIGYNIWTGELTSEIEELFNQILSTFKFTE